MRLIDADKLEDFIKENSFLYTNPEKLLLETLISRTPTVDMSELSDKLVDYIESEWEDENLEDMKPETLYRSLIVTIRSFFWKKNEEKK